MDMQRIAAIQMTSSTEVQANLRQTAIFIHQAASQGAKLIVLPENFALMPANDAEKNMIQEQYGQGPLQAFLAAEAKKHQVWLVGGSIPLTSHDRKKPYNASIVFDSDGKEVACYRKIHLFDVEVTPEKEIYQESTTASFGKDICLVPTPFGCLGLAICYDIRFPELFRAMVSKGAEIIALPTAFTVKTGQAHWEVLTRARAIENFCYFIGACQSGKHKNGRETYGHSLIIDPWGRVMNTLPQGEGVICADISLSELKQIRKSFPSLLHRKI